MEDNSIINRVVEISTTVSNDVKKPKSYFNPNSHMYSPEMKEHNQWILSRLKKLENRYTKIPCDASGNYYDCTDQNNCMSFEIAFKTCKENPGKFSGIGFSIFSFGKIKGIDFDHVYDPDAGEWNQEAWQELKSLNTRVEWGPSHTGVHVFFICPIVLENGNETQPDGSKREMYFEKHYITVTGEVVEGFPSEINEVDLDLIRQLYEKWFTKKAVKKEKTVNKTKSVLSALEIPVSSANNSNNPLKGLHPTKDQIIILCRDAPNGFGDKFVALFNGDISGYGSESEADMALAGMIAFHTSDYRIIKDIIYESALWDKKWERDNYCQRTIMTAIRNRRGSK